MPGEVRARRQEGIGAATRRQERLQTGGSAQGGLDCRLEAGHGEERTLNICSMVVTLEVSKLSGWLNAPAFCRESKGGHAMRDEVRPGRRAGVGRQRRTQRAREGAAAD